MDASLIAEGARVFVATLEGREPPGGDALTVLAFVTAADEGAAMRQADAELARLGWSDVRALRAAEVVDAEAMPPDFADAMAQALTWGCGLIIYDRP